MVIIFHFTSQTLQTYIQLCNKMCINFIFKAMYIVKNNKVNNEKEIKPFDIIFPV